MFSKLTIKLTYRDKMSSFEALLRKDGSVSFHHTSLYLSAIEMYKVLRELILTVFSETF